MRQYGEKEEYALQIADRQDQSAETPNWSLFSDYWAWMKPKKDELWYANGRINEIWQSRGCEYVVPIAQ